MAVLSDADRDLVAKALIRKAFVDLNQTANLTTTEVRTLINDLDTYVDTNASAINSSITLTVRNKATIEMKALAMAWVALKRAGVTV